MMDFSLILNTINSVLETKRSCTVVCTVKLKNLQLFKLNYLLFFLPTRKLLMIFSALLKT